VVRDARSLANLWSTPVKENRAGRHTQFSMGWAAFHLEGEACFSFFFFLAGIFFSHYAFTAILTRTEMLRCGWARIPFANVCS
jgi:hypothetical protein